MKLLSLPVLFFVIINVTGADLELTVNPDEAYQTIRHFGSSAAFDLNEITDSWSDEGKERLAESIFSRETDSLGNPKGLGLSSFRIEIGAGSREQGSSSNIGMESRRAPCALQEDGSYDWSRIDAETFWVDKAYEYGVEVVFGYSNSPPVFFTINGLACRTQEVPSANLKDDCYDDFAEFLAQVALYYAGRNTPLHYISPVNEPQWDWFCENQEGSRWNNDEIKDLVIAIDTTFKAHDLATKITITEGGSIDRIYGFEGDPTGDQLRFWEEENELYIGDRDVLAPYVAGHGYWTEDTDRRLVETRQEMYERIKETDEDLEWWQSEYSFLGDGYLDGKNSLEPVDYGLFLAKVIHHDLTLGNASGWQYWETFGIRGTTLRYMLVRASGEEAVPEKTGWALCHYSFFIRPGMKRIGISRSDNAEPLETVDGILPSAYLNETTGELVVVVVNYEDSDNTIHLAFSDASQPVRFFSYLTTGSESVNMAQQEEVTSDEDILLPGRSITTFVTKGAMNFVHDDKGNTPGKTYDVFSGITSAFQEECLTLYIGDKESRKNSVRVEIVDLKGRTLLKTTLTGESHMERLVLPPLSRGVYYLRISNEKYCFIKTIFDHGNVR
jgi:O-glycosyl hydrolase